MRVLVIGGTGYIGGHIAGRLRTCGFDVTVFSRGRTEPPELTGIEVIHGDRHVPEDLKAAARLGFDAVVDGCAYRRQETQAVIDAFSGRISRFVHISSVSANRLTSGFPLSENDPLVTDPSKGYGYEKAECERALHQAHAKSDFPYVSIRPVVVFGPRDRISRENYYLKRLLAGDTIILPDGGRTLACGVFVQDVADAVAGAIVSETASGHAYHLMMRERITLAEHVASLARAVDRDPEIIEIPSHLLERVGFNLFWFPYFTGGVNLDLNTSAAVRDLNFRPTPYPQALDATVSWFLEHTPESLPSIEDRFPPILGRTAQSEFARKYQSRIEALEAALVEEHGNLMAGYTF